MATLFKTVTTTLDSKPDAPTTPRSRLLILSSRGVTYRHRHLLNDLVSMLPHSRKDAKLDTKNRLGYLNEVAELYNCNGVVFFEARKRMDLYLWLGRVANGPCVKFHLMNRFASPPTPLLLKVFKLMFGKTVHTMSELNFTGNALRGSRAIVSFDAGFDTTPAMALVKEMLRSTFSVPKGVRGSKPFVDRVVAFTLADGKVWCRHYQICTSSTTEREGEEGEGEEKTGKGRKKEGEEMELVEIGPRFVMTPIVVLEGSFGGPVVYENKEFVSPNAVRREVRERRAVRKGGREVQRIKKGVKRREVEKEVAVRREGEIDDAVLFA